MIDQEGLDGLVERLPESERFLRAISHFIEMEYVHARAMSDHMDRREGKEDFQDWSHSRDDVDLAHALIMNWPAITADIIASDLRQAAQAITSLQGEVEDLRAAKYRALDRRDTAEAALASLREEIASLRGSQQSPAEPGLGRSHD